MASTQSDIITSVSDVRQEATTTSNTKQKLLVPRRIMEEEVWLSGSELKTDNSSSEEDCPTDAQDRAKKGAKKKTKTFSHSARSRKQILRQNREETTTEIVETIKEVTSTTSSTVEGMDGLKSPVGYNTTLDALDKMLTKCENHSNDFMKLSCNKADDEKSQLQKIKQLEERIARAEKVYMEAREETDRLIIQMENMLHNVAGLEGPDWEFFTDITKKWICCFSGANSKASVLSRLSDGDIEDDNQNIEKNQLRKSRHISIKNKDKNKRLIKIRKGTNCNIVLKNIKQSSKTRYFQDIKPPTLTSYESNRLNTLLSSPEEIYKEDGNYAGFKLRPEELDKLSNISSQLHFTRRSSSRLDENENDLDQDLEINEIADGCFEPRDSSANYSMNPDYIQNASLTDSQKQMLVNASHSNVSLIDSMDEYGSCDEINSEFASSTNLDLAN